jgi:hypothetical protein
MVVVAEVVAARVVETAPVVATAAAAVTAVAIPVQGWGLSAPQIPKAPPLQARDGWPTPALMMILVLALETATVLDVRAARVIVMVLVSQLRSVARALRVGAEE